MRLKSKIAIVTGGSSGIGKAIAELFIQEGAKVAIMDKVLPEKDEGWTVFQKDVSNPDSCKEVIDKTVAQFGKINILVNNAGIGVPGNLQMDDSVNVWKKVLDTNLNGLFYMINFCLPHMMELDEPCSIINMSSISAKVMNPTMHPSYSASKGGIISLTKVLGPSYAKYGVRFNCICPGAVKTPLWYALPEEIKEQFGGLHPLGAGFPEDVAYLALYLASDESKWVTGSTIVIDGGNICSGGLAELAKEIL